MSNNRYGNLLDKVMNKNKVKDTSIYEHIDRFNDSIEASKNAEKNRRAEVVRQREQKQNEETQRVKRHEEAIANYLKKKEEQKQKLDEMKRKEQEKADEYKTLEYYASLNNPELAESYAKMIANKH